MRKTRWYVTPKGRMDSLTVECVSPSASPRYAPVTRRRPGEIVCRKPGSCFVGSGKPRYVWLPSDDWEHYDPPEEYCVICDNPNCREWPNVYIVTGPHVGGVMYHLSECQMEDFDGPGGRGDNA